MAPAADIDVNPHGRVFYSLLLLIASLVGVMFAAEVFAPDAAPFSWRLIHAVAAAVLLFGALQAFERLVRPKAAQARSRALSASMRGNLSLMSKVAQGLSILPLAGSLMLWTAGRSMHDLAADLLLLWAVLALVRYSLADLAGDPGLRATNRRPFSNPVK